MPISRERKEELVASYVSLLEESDGFTIVKTTGMKVSAVQDLRNTIREAGGQYMVAKNTLMTKALEQSGWVVPEELLKGPSAIVFGRSNFPGVVKALLDYMDDKKIAEEKLAISGGVMGGQSIWDAQQAEAISKMPTLPEIQAQIIGLLIAPQQQLVNVLQQANSGVVNVLQAADSQVVNVLQAWIAKREQEEGAA